MTEDYNELFSAFDELGRETDELRRRLEKAEQLAKALKPFAKEWLSVEPYYPLEDDYRRAAEALAAWQAPSIEDDL